jgi:hypothetical protein
MGPPDVELRLPLRPTVVQGQDRGTTVESNRHVAEARIEGEREILVLARPPEHQLECRTVTEINVARTRALARCLPVNRLDEIAHPRQPDRPGLRP